MSNGLREKFNGTLKGMLKKTCQKRPLNWDRYLLALLFAYREKSPNLAPASYLLLDGHTVKGPVQLRRDIGLGCNRDN